MLVQCNTRIKADILNRRIAAFREEVDRITLYIHLKHSEMVFCPLLYLEDCKIKLQKNMDMYNSGEDYQCMSDKLNKI